MSLYFAVCVMLFGGIVEAAPRSTGKRSLSPDAAAGDVSRIKYLRGTRPMETELRQPRLASNKTPFGTPYADECPAVKVHTPRTSDLPTDELRIVSWNVEWAFSPRSKRVNWVKDVVEPALDTSVLRCPQDMFNGSLIAKPFRFGHPCHSENGMEEHLFFIAEALARMNPRPHIVNLVEIDGCNAANDISRYLAGYQPYVAFGDDDRTNEQVGFISAIPPVGPLRRDERVSASPVPGNTQHCNVKMGDQGLSKHYIAKFDIPGKLRFYLVGVHLKSMRQEQTGEACSIREAEAKVLDGILHKLHLEDPDAEVAVMGDFNDFDRDVPDRRGAFYSQRFGREFPTGSYLGCVKEANGTMRKDWVADEGALGQNSRVFDIIKGDGLHRPRLENLMGRVERARRYSHRGATFTAFTSACGVARWYGEKDCGAPRPQGKLDNSTDSRDCSGDSLLDYILTTSRLAAVVKDVRILNDADFELAYGPRFKRASFFAGIELEKLRAVRDKNHEAQGFNPSDHFPVELVIDLTKLSTL